MWRTTGANWEKGNCIVEIERQCEGGFEHVNVEDISEELNGVLVQDTDEVRKCDVPFN